MYSIITIQSLSKVIKDICGNHLFSRQNLIFLFLLFLIKDKFFRFLFYRMDPIFTMSSDEEYPVTSPLVRSAPETLSGVDTRREIKRVKFSDTSQIACDSEDPEVTFDFQDGSVNFVEKGYRTDYQVTKMIKTWWSITPINRERFFAYHRDHIWASPESFEEISAYLQDILVRIKRGERINLAEAYALPWDHNLDRVQVASEEKVKSCYSHYMKYHGHPIESEKDIYTNILLGNEFSIENNPLAQIVTPQTDLDDLDRRYNALLQFVEENMEIVEPAQPEETLARSGPSMICGVPRIQSSTGTIEIPSSSSSSSSPSSKESIDILDEKLNRILNMS